jgi:hypothetical protein
MRTKRTWVSNPQTIRRSRKTNIITSRKPKLIILNHKIGVEGMSRRYAEEVLAKYVASYRESEKVDGYEIIHYFSAHQESTEVQIELIYSDANDIRPMLNKISDENNVVDAKQLKRFLAIHDVLR